MSKILLILNDIINIILKYYGGKESKSISKPGKDSKTFRRLKNPRSGTAKRKKNSTSTTD